MLVVLPTPFTPTMRRTPSSPAGASISPGSAGATSCRLRTSSSCRTRYRSFELLALPSSTSLRRISINWSVVCTPTSACSRSSSSSSQRSSSMGRACSNTDAMRAKMPSRDFSTDLSSLKNRLRITISIPGGCANGVCYRSGFHRKHVGNARGIHADTVHGVGLVHRRSIVSDDDELYPSGELGQQVCEALHVGLVQRRIHFVEHTERGRVDFQQPEQERDDRQRALATAQR